MTWVEAGLLLSVAGVALGALTRRAMVGRLVMWISLVALLALAASFGRELVIDLM